MDRCTRSLLAWGIQPDRIHRLLQLDQRFGIGVQAFRLSLRAAGLAHWTGGSHATDASRTQRLMDTLSFRLTQRLAVAIEDDELTPAELSRLGSCFAHNQQAFARLQTQKLAHKRYAHDRIAQKRKEAARTHKEPGLSLEERIRRIYGLDPPNPHSVVKGAPSP